MFDRARIKRKAKDQLGYNQNLSGMIGANFLCKILENGVDIVVQGLAITSVGAALNSFGLSYKMVSGILNISARTRADILDILVLVITSMLPTIFTCSLLYMLLNFASSVVAQVAVVPVQIGLYRYHLYIEKNNRRTKVTSIFDGFDNFGNFAYAAIIRCFWITLIPTGVFVLGLLITLVMVLLTPGIVTKVIMAVVFAVLSSIASVIVKEYLKLQTWMMPWLLADNPDLDAKQARVKSKRLTKGHILDLWIFELSFFWTWGLLSSLTVGIVGLLYGDSYYNTACALVYEHLKGSPIELRDITLPAVQAASPAGGMAERAPRLNSASPINAAGVMIGIAGMYTGSRFPLEANRPVVIGRDATQASIVLSKGTEKISRRHCTVMFNSSTNQYEVTDHSSNGVYVGGKRLAKEVKVALPRGAEIMLGNEANIFRLT